MRVRMRGRRARLCPSCLGRRLRRRDPRGRQARDRPRLRRPGLRADASSSWPRAGCRTSRGSPRRAASRRWARRSRRRARSPGRRSSPASIRAATASSTSSIATRRRWCPYLSTSTTEAVRSRKLTVGDWQFPLSGGSVELLRQGQPFWDVLEARGVETTIIRMPANFPPSGTATRELSGMGTPDILGTYGTFSFYTSEPFAFGGRDAVGRQVLYPVDGRGQCRPRGAARPRQSVPRKRPRRSRPTSRSTSTPSEPVAKLVVGDEERVLAVGEWSDWVPVDFDLRVPFQSVRGMRRFYLKQVRPVFELYVIPDQPRSAVAGDAGLRRPRTTPPSWPRPPAASTRRACPRTPKALRRRRADARTSSCARLGWPATRTGVQYRYVLDQFTGGLLFYYFGNVDQVVAHDVARQGSRPSGLRPGDRRPLRGRHRGALRRSRPDRRRDARRASGPDATLVVMSDHGFTSWRRSFHLNTLAEGAGLSDAARTRPRATIPASSATSTGRARAPTASGSTGSTSMCRAARCRASSRRREREAWSRRSPRSCSQTIDPTTGQRAITKVHRREEVYTRRAAISTAPPISSSATPRARAGPTSPRSASIAARGDRRQHRIPGAATTAWITRPCRACFCRTGRCASRRHHSTRSPRPSWRSSGSTSSPCEPTTSK